MRAVLDANVLISGVLSSRGASAELLRATRDGHFELIVSEFLLSELRRAFTYPKLRNRVSAQKAEAFINWLREHAALAEDPSTPPSVHSADPDDDYLIVLAISERAFVVSGDQHLLSLGDKFPIFPPAEFLLTLAQRG